MSEWQPIKTAPKDAGPLILYIPELKRERADVSLPAMLKIDHVGCCGSRRPTHWMPLPEPPEDA